ncbi:MAG: bifunctional oligoribonuclease/PAP phosphatase NrnA [Ignavibacteria bacterium]|jgi:phosphoesterase RecJ-like protein|nr:bifunctional oligoribonuclease/PAP phosphatase NrnA [Ignavibacteria bacterium]
MEQLNNSLDYSQAIELLYAADSVLITSHSNPDGDAIGSCLALYELCKDMGKRVTVLINGSECPTQYRFLANSNKVKCYDVERHSRIINSADVVFMLDFNDITRINLLGERIMESPCRKVLIDHHICPSINVDVVLSDANACATGQLMYDFFTQGRFPITKTIAEALYTAILTDSGCFRFSTTTASVHKIAGELINAGVEPDVVYDKIYNRNTYARLHLQALGVANMRFYKDGAVSVMPITIEDFEASGATLADIENLSQIGLGVDGVSISIAVIFDYEQSVYKVSLRSKGTIDVRSIAMKFGGGGHLNAAGCKVQRTSSIEEVIEQLLSTIN